MKISTYLEKNKKFYNSSGNLYKLIPNIKKDSEYVNITYYSRKTQEITDSYGNKAKFYYNSNGLLNGIFFYRKNPQTSNINLVQINWYTYDYLSRLTMIERDDRRPTESKIEQNTIYENYEDLEFKYDDRDRLSYIKDNITNGVKFLYDKANRINKASQVIENINDDETPYLNFQYDSLGRRLTIIDANNYKNTYTFDKEFHTKSISNSAGYTSFYEYHDIFYNNGIEERDPNYYLRHKIKNASQPYYSGYNLLIIIVLNFLIL